MLFLGILSVIIGLLFLQWCGTNYLRPAISRPPIFHSSIFLITSLIVQAILIIGGFFFVFTSSITVGIILLSIIVIIRLWFAKESSTKATRNAMYKTYYKAKRLYPLTNINIEQKEKLEREKQILLHTLEPRYRYWGNMIWILFRA